ncbi:hypothetical protein F2Q70_00016758 [Brassica cretica]|uniref:Reverse transcriptase zinc-binding domain-containing protein n=1 Tax=Brassica cretica TaxID=69181 RepID=A0A8S9HVY9_BRACR|nr:hypothetical protein F2Q70_00016758 [Brassica cretica]
MKFPVLPCTELAVTSNLVLKVSDLLLNGTATWNRKLDPIRWSFTKDSIYSTRSGYQFTEALLDLQNQNKHSMPHVEEKLWSSIWKIKAPPKIKNFIWRSLSGALAVKERLRTRGIPVDSMCLGCGSAS